MGRKSKSKIIMVFVLDTNLLIIEGAMPKVPIFWKPLFNQLFCASDCKRYINMQKKGSLKRENKFTF